MNLILDLDCSNLVDLLRRSYGDHPLQPVHSLTVRPSAGEAAAAAATGASMNTRLASSNKDITRTMSWIAERSTSIVSSDPP